MPHAPPLEGPRAQAAGTDTTILRLEGVTKLFGKTRAVDNSSLEIRRGEVFTLLGPSGCGKTTTLRMVAGLEHNDGGRIVYRGHTVADPQHRIFVLPEKRNMGMVFQSYAIWPHMTVFDNVAYPLELRGVRRSDIKQRVVRMLEMVGLAGLEDRAATTLSGGQQQRVALSRALVYEPELLLLDEPFSNLDAKLRNQMRLEVKDLQQRLGISVLFVTHDQIEGMTLSDRIGVMNLGKVEQVGTPADVYDNPATPFVRDFLGATITLRGTIAESTDGSIAVAVGNGAVIHAARHHLPRPHRGEPASVSIRPDDIEVLPCSADDTSRTNVVRGTIEHLTVVGTYYEATVSAATGQRITLNLPRREQWSQAQRVVLRLPQDRTQAWPD
jgi:ABC-type Fe3+/spermidine/putrescine transport system ATPase subunit